MTEEWSERSMIGGLVVIISLITLVTSSQLMITSTTQVASGDGGLGTNAYTVQVVYGSMNPSNFTGVEKKTRAFLESPQQNPGQPGQ